MGGLGVVLCFYYMFLWKKYLGGRKDLVGLEKMDFMVRSYNSDYRF